MKWTDRMLRNFCVGIAITIVSWSVVSIGCAFDVLSQMQTIEDPDWDSMQTIEDPDWDSVR